MKPLLKTLPISSIINIASLVVLLNTSSVIHLLDLSLLLLCDYFIPISSPSSSPFPLLVTNKIIVSIMWAITNDSCGLLHVGPSCNWYHLALQHCSGEQNETVGSCRLTWFKLSVHAWYTSPIPSCFLIWINEQRIYELLDKLPL